MICVTEYSATPIAAAPVEEELLLAKEAGSSKRTNKNHPRLASILYVEDDSAIRLCWSELLTCAGYSVTAVADGIEAWEALQSGRYDLLVTDNDMPRLTGM